MTRTISRYDAFCSGQPVRWGHQLAPQPPLALPPNWPGPQSAFSPIRGGAGQPTVLHPSQLAPPPISLSRQLGVEPIGQPPASPPRCPRSPDQPPWDGPAGSHLCTNLCIRPLVKLGKKSCDKKYKLYYIRSTKCRLCVLCHNGYAEQFPH